MVIWFLSGVVSVEYFVMNLCLALDKDQNMHKHDLDSYVFDLLWMLSLNRVQFIPISVK